MLLMIVIGGGGGGFFALLYLARTFVCRKTKMIKCEDVHGVTEYQMAYRVGKVVKSAPYISYHSLGYTSFNNTLEPLLGSANAMP